MKRMIIGFGHKRRRGKDLACELVKDTLEALDEPVRIDSFAHSIKEGIGKGVFGFSDDQLYGDLKAAVDPFWGITPRDGFQRFGTDVMHTQFGADIWVRTLLRRAEADPNTHILISDVRFPAEVQALAELGAWLVRIDRAVSQSADATEDTHYSEIALDDWDGWDAVFNNNSTIDELRDCLVRWLRMRFLEVGERVALRCFGPHLSLARK